MVRNNKYALIGHLGICVIVLYVGGFTPNIVRQIFVALTVFVLYFVLGSSFPNQNSTLKNLISVSAPSILGLVLVVYSILVYQFSVINAFNYHETVHYKVIWYISSNFNASAVPAANFIGKIFSSFMLPYGLICTFLIPTFMMWLGMEWRRRKRGLQEAGLY